MLTSSAPLRCTSPADVYLLLKSSDFATHDLDEGRIFEGCVDNVHFEGHQLTNGLGNGLVNGSAPESTNVTPSQGEQGGTVELELVLKKWYEIERSREVRCFIRNNFLLGKYTITIYGLTTYINFYLWASHLPTGPKFL